MSDPSIPLSLLTRFHREVIVPDIERIVGGAERRLRDEMQTLHDAVLGDLQRLEFEYQSIRAGLARLELRLDSLEAGHRDLLVELHDLGERLGRLEKRVEQRIPTERDFATRAEVHQLRARVEDLQTRMDELERRLP